MTVGDRDGKAGSGGATAGVGACYDTACAVTECAIVGSGATGLTAALALAATGFEVVLIGPAPPVKSQQDTRTAALFPSSIELLRTLGVFEPVAATSAPLAAIRLVDATDGLLRAPEVLFTAAEVGLSSFGYNVPNAALIAALAEAVRNEPRITWLADGEAQSIAPGPDGVRITAAAGVTISARLVVGADGRGSRCRTAAGIDAKVWDYPQAALTTSFGHARPHRSISTEFHRQAGPLTTVPMPGHRSSLVWVERPAIAERLAALPASEFTAALEAHLKGLLGAIGDVGPIRVFQLGGLEAERLGRNRIALVGEAAHAFPPIGAQGLNLGFRDVAAMVECVAMARLRCQDIGSEAVLAAYSASRARDVASRVAGVDLLNRSLLTELLPVQLARGAGLHALKTIAPLRRWAIAAGLSSPGPLPRLMQPGGGGLVAAR